MTNVYYQKASLPSSPLLVNCNVGKYQFNPILTRASDVLHGDKTSAEARYLVYSLSQCISQQPWIRPCIRVRAKYKPSHTKLIDHLMSCWNKAGIRGALELVEAVLDARPWNKEGVLQESCGGEARILRTSPKSFQTSSNSS